MNGDGISWCHHGFLRFCVELRLIMSSGGPMAEHQILIFTCYVWSSEATGVHRSVCCMALPSGYLT